jgi:cation transport ATPase
MHDVHRDSLIYKGRDRKKKKHQNAPTHEQKHDQDHDQEHDHSHEHENDHEHGHDHEPSVPQGHEHKHHDDEYESHDEDNHVHKHEREAFEDHAFAHMHEHGHSFFHVHHHSHHPEHSGVIHKIFNDPVRDWFAVIFVGVLIFTGYQKWLPGHLSEGVILCAAVICSFPIFKNALFECIAKRKVNIEIFFAGLLLAGLFGGKFLEVALMSLFLLLGSFMRLNFSWRN